MAEGVGIGLGLIRYLVINRLCRVPGDDGRHDHFGLSRRARERDLGLQWRHPGLPGWLEGPGQETYLLPQLERQGQTQDGKNRHCEGECFDDNDHSSRDTRSHPEAQ